jgi:hypothetical protein
LKKGNNCFIILDNFKFRREKGKRGLIYTPANLSPNEKGKEGNLKYLGN